MSALFSGAEIALLSSNKLYFELEKKKERIKGHILNLYYQQPNQFVTAMQTGKIISLVIFGLQTHSLFSSFFPEINEFLFLFIQSIIVTFLMLSCGEFIPKMYAKLNPYSFLSFWSVPLFPFYVILLPLAFILTFIIKIFFRVFGIKISFDLSFKILGKDDLDLLIQKTIENSHEKSEIETEVKYFQNALEFSNVKLRNCIVPRTEIVAFDIQTSIEDLLSSFIETGLSKILIYKENIDNIVGYIHSSEMFTKPKDWTKHINTISVVPENMSANKLMKSMLQDKKNIAIVVDEFGGTSGVITLEDLVEEIFGEIEDEHDTKSHVMRKISEKEYIFSGRIEIDKINQNFGLQIPDSEEYVTIAGFILNKYKNFPKLNESITINKYSFKIIKVTSTKIELVKLIVT